MLYLGGVIGQSTDPDISERLHDLGHRGGLEHIEIAERDATRRRLRVTTDKGTDCAIALPRDQRLKDGDVLLLEGERAVVVRVGAQRWLRLSPRDAAVALRLGYHAGNMHWQVRFDGTDLLIAMNGAREANLTQLNAFLEQNDIDMRDDP